MSRTSTSFTSCCSAITCTGRIAKHGYQQDVYTRYPFQGSYTAYRRVIKECIVGVIEARFGT